MSEKNNGGDWNEISSTRRKVLYAGSGLATGLFGSGLGAASNGQEDHTAATVEESPEIDVLYRSNSGYKYSRSRYNGETHYIRETPEGKIQILEDNFKQNIATASTEQEVAYSLAATTDNKWDDYVVDFEPTSRGLYEECEANDDYGYHYVRGASVEFTRELRGIVFTKVTSILGYIAGEVGIPEVGTVVSAVAGAVATLAIAELTFGAVDHDSWRNTPVMKVKYSRYFNTAVENGQTVSYVPGAHVKSNLEY